MNRQPRLNPQGSLVIALTALLTLGIAFILPAISDEFPGGAASQETRIVSAPMRALEKQRSAMSLVEGGVYFRGTTLDEVETALAACTECDDEIAESAAPPHRVEVDPFWMEINEVTYAQYVAFLNTLGSGSHLTGCQGNVCALTQDEDLTSGIVQSNGQYVTVNPAYDDYPIVNVSWYGAQAYCASLDRRLPTEAEWEFAARGSAETLYPWGDEWAMVAANVRGTRVNADGVITAGPEPVGGFANWASRDGIRDLAGNVSEWTSDWYDANYYRTLDASRRNDPGPESGTAKVVRGGSWDQSEFFARSVNRQFLTPESMASDVGFRCVSN
jgi:formylglycine-generating enzyme required for sulfatase activity